jgi:transposase
MKSTEIIKKLQAYIRKLKKQRPTKSIQKAIERAKALMAYNKGISLDVIAAVFHISKKTLQRLIKKFSQCGIECLYDADRSGRPRNLTPEQEEELKGIITEQNQRVWTARHVYNLILTTTGVCFSVAYLPQLLRRIGLSFHKTMYELVRRDSEKRREWIQEKLPEIYKKKIAEGWRIFYQDEVGFSREGTLVRSWGNKGNPKKIPNYGRGKNISLIGVFEVGSGHFYGELEEDSVDGDRFRTFVLNLKKSIGSDKILLICDNARIHKSEDLKQWYQQNESWLSIEFLPTYSPDFNPIERLWKWCKQNFTHNRCWKTNGLLIRDLERMIKELQQDEHDLTPIMRKENDRFKEIAQYYETSAVVVFDLAA